MDRPIGPYEGVQENILIIGDQSETYRRPIGDRHARSETHRRPRHASLVTHLKPTCPIGDPSETNTPHRRSIGDRHA